MHGVGRCLRPRYKTLSLRSQESIEITLRGLGNLRAFRGDSISQALSVDASISIGNTIDNDPRRINAHIPIGFDGYPD